MQFTTIDSDKESLQRAYGPCANSVLDQMSFLVGRIIGGEPVAWAVRAYANGLLVPVPAVFNPAVLTELHLRQTFHKAITRAAEAFVHATNGGELPEEVVSACKDAEDFCRLTLVN
ncbi:MULTISPECIES: hypothetical protein [Pseudomonas]|uniref:Uncharacterized protein n=1 Tax=Pseudomonas fluorescens TaxID=294 RepID=A0A161ZA87_PSEFL|nr:MULTISPECIES: hypothetical protein [Pseudomonas]KZN20627.1 hypothetical protein A1D17_03555 [Pseudomonas fluorescens]